MSNGLSSFFSSERSLEFIRGYEDIHNRQVRIEFELLNRLCNQIVIGAASDTYGVELMGFQ